MPTYDLCSDVDKEVEKMVQTLCLFTPEFSQINQNEVKINCLFAYANVNKRGKKIGNAVTVNGYPAIAQIKVTSYKDRVKGMADAELIIDHDWWKNHSEDECKAVLDHELTHLTLVEDKYGRIKRDKMQRPRLKLRLHDMQFGWFNGVARRHGVDSQEWKQAQELIKPEAYQLYFEAIMEPSPKVEEPALA